MEKNRKFYYFTFESTKNPYLTMYTTVDRDSVSYDRIKKDYYEAKFNSEFTQMLYDVVKNSELKLKIVGYADYDFSKRNEYISYNRILNEYDGKITYRVFISLFKDIDSNNMEEVLSKTYELFKYVKNRKYERTK